MPNRDEPNTDKRRSESVGKGDPIDANIKRVYDQTLKEPLPRRLTDLLERLKESGTSR